MVLGLGCVIAKDFFISLPTVSLDGEIYILGEQSFQSGSQLGQGVQDLQGGMVSSKSTL